MKEIVEWLKNPRHYKIGVMLYLKHGSNNLFKKAISTEEETPYKKKRIIKELQDLVDLGTVNPSIGSDRISKTNPVNPSIGSDRISKPNPVNPSISPVYPSISSDGVPKPKPVNPSIGSDAVDADFITELNKMRHWPRSACRDNYELGLWEKAATLLKEVAALHAYLSSAPSDFERRMYAFELLRKDDELDEVYDARDMYKGLKIKKEADEEIEYVTDPYLMAKRIENLKKYIRRVKGDIVKLGDTEDRRDRLEMFVKEFNYYATKTITPKRNA